MSLFIPTTSTCGLCGHTVEYTVPASLSLFGSPDLDFRPPENGSFATTLPIIDCPRCGYVHADIETDGAPYKDLVNSEAYKQCDGHALSSDTSRCYYRFAMMALSQNDPRLAYEAFLHAAWAADDEKDADGALLCRNKAVALYHDGLFDGAEFALRHVDVLRRAKQFDSAVSYLEQLRFDDAQLQKAVGFQRRLLQMHNTKRYRMTDVDAVFMKLDDEPYESMRRGKKTVEVRCNDEKRRALKKGDTVFFIKRSDPDKIIRSTVAELRAFDTFEELYAAIPADKCGCHGKTVSEMLSYIDSIYTKEQQAQYGALAILLQEDPFRMLFPEGDYYDGE